MSKITIRHATPNDLETLLQLTIRLGELELLPQRAPEMFWQGDAEWIKTWARERPANRDIVVATDAEDQVLGFLMYVIREDWLSHEPNIYIDSLAVSDQAEGLGIGSRLLERVEEIAQEQGIKILSLQVVGTNTRARRLYQKMGFTEEVIRNVKFLD